MAPDAPVGTSSPSRSVTEIRVHEDLDLATADDVRAALMSALARAPVGCVLLHLGTDRFVGLAGLRMLLGVAAEVRRRGGVLVVVSPPRSLRALVDHVGCADELPMVRS